MLYLAVFLCKDSKSLIVITRVLGNSTVRKYWKCS